MFDKCKNKVIIICAHDPTRKTDAKTLVLYSMVLVRIMMDDLFEQGCKMQSGNADAHFCIICIGIMVVTIMHDL